MASPAPDVDYHARVARFYSIPGTSPRQNDGRGGIPVRDRLMALHPEYYAAKGEGPPVTGFAPGEEIDMAGTPARVLGEEYDQHRGTVEQHVRVSSQVDSGTRKIVWHPTSEGTMTIGDIRRIHE